MELNMEEKKCTTCGEFKPLNMFVLRKDSLDGYRNTCKKCFTSNNRDKKKTYKDIIRGYCYIDIQGYKYCNSCKSWKKLDSFNNNVLRLQGKASTCRSCEQSYVSNYYIRTQGQSYKRGASKRRALKNGVEENFSVSDRHQIIKIFNGRCFKCNSEENLEIDHHYPLNNGYPLKFGNAVLLCKSCNCSKNSYLPEEWYSKKELQQLTYFGILS